MPHFASRSAFGIALAVTLAPALGLALGLAIGLLAPAPAAADGPAVQPPHYVQHPPRSYRPAYRDHRRGGGYAIHARPYRTYYVDGYETGNAIGTEGLEFNFPGTDNRRPGYHAVRRPLGHDRSLACRPRPVQGPDGSLWYGPLDFDCW
jgi:hypothetical protein